jgi:hypothetical protein
MLIYVKGMSRRLGIGADSIDIVASIRAMVTPPSAIAVILSDVGGNLLLAQVVQCFVDFGGESVIDFRSIAIRQQRGPLARRLNNRSRTCMT